MILAAVCFIINGAISICYAYSRMPNGGSWHTWIKDRPTLDNIVFCIGLLGFGYGMYILIVF